MIFLNNRVVSTCIVCAIVLVFCGNEYEYFCTGHSKYEVSDGFSGVILFSDIQCFNIKHLKCFINYSTEILILQSYT